jgi:hypothetical protein
MLQIRSKESDCRIKGFVIEIIDDIKEKIKAFERGGMKFDMIMGVGTKNDFMDEWGSILRNNWSGVNKVWVETQTSDTVSSLNERMINQLYYVTE